MHKKQRAEHDSALRNENGLAVRSCIDIWGFLEAIALTRYPELVARKAL